jgi:DNA-directed RNA polymerase sigma subunit (sigma70/sigma32)
MIRIEASLCRYCRSEIDRAEIRSQSDELSSSLPPHLEESIAKWSRTNVGDPITLRGQVFDDAVRQALAGAPLQEVCAALQSRYSITPEEIAAEVKRRQEKSEKFVKTMRKFFGKDRKILEFKWGFKDGRLHSADETGKVFGVSAHEVKDVETKARKML